MHKVHTIHRYNVKNNQEYRTAKNEIKNEY